MNVLVDYQIFFLQKYGGISRYHSQIDKYINNYTAEDKSTILSYGCENGYVDSSYQYLSFLNKQGYGRRSLLKKINEYLTLASINLYDVFHPTYYDTYFIRTNKKPLVITVHDMIPEKYFPNEKQELIRNKKKLIEKADAIIAISEYTKKELLNLYNIDENIVKVIYHGLPEEFTAIRSEEVENRLQENYILFIGNREGYKNFDWFIKSSSSFFIENNIKIKVVGNKFKDNEENIIKNLGLGHLVDNVGSVSDEELFVFYKNALCFVFPSLEEGFGLPLLEAFVAKCPILCTDNLIFKEICKDAAVYFEAGNKEDLILKLEEVCYNFDTRKSIKEKGINVASSFQWEAAAKQTLNVYKQLT